MRYRLMAGLIMSACAALADAQTAPSESTRSVDDYLCTFAGKCDGTSASAATMAAPATKGFRLAAPQNMAAGQPASVARPAAPMRHGATSARMTARTPAVARASAPMAVPAGAHANLLLTFAKGSDRMTDLARRNATAFATALMRPELSDKRFLIEGHTDTRGSPAGNLTLSQHRAEAVVDFLVARGVDRSRLSASGVGSTKPLPGTSAASPSNRRVEAVLLS